MKTTSAPFGELSSTQLAILPSAKGARRPISYILFNSHNNRRVIRSGLLPFAPRNFVLSNVTRHSTKKKKQNTIFFSLFGRQERDKRSIGIVFLCPLSMKLLTSTLFLFAAVTQFCSATLCPLTSEGFSGLGTEYALSELGKLSVLGFSATVKYATLAAGTCETLVFLSKHCMEIMGVFCGMTLNSSFVSVSSCLYRCIFLLRFFDSQVVSISFLLPSF